MSIPPSIIEIAVKPPEERTEKEKDYLSRWLVEVPEEQLEKYLQIAPTWKGPEKSNKGGSHESDLIKIESDERID